MNIGYVSQTFGVPYEKFKSVQLKNASDEKLMELIEHNLKNLMRIMDYNINNHVYMFRIISDVIPFGSHEVNTLKWWELFSEQLESIGKKAIKNEIRLSMHPGQYTVLNSPDSGVVERAVADLEYHNRFLDAMKLDSSHKIILHVGGVYGNKEQAMARFIENYQKLDASIQKRLIIENDDRQYTVADVLAIAKEAKIPVVFDNLHHQCNPAPARSEMEWLLAARDTWGPEDGRQKIHYAQQDPNKRLGAHSQTIDLAKFNQFYQEVPTRDIDIMFEVKDKNLSALKGINLLAKPDLKNLIREWTKYEYSVLERSPQIHSQIAELLEETESYPVIEFYQLIDDALTKPVQPEYSVIVAKSIWDKINTVATEQTHNVFKNELLKIKEGGSTRKLKRLLWKLVVEKQDQRLMQALYFDELY